MKVDEKDVAGTVEKTDTFANTVEVKSDETPDMKLTVKMPKPTEAPISKASLLSAAKSRIESGRMDLFGYFAPKFEREGFVSDPVHRTFTQGKVTVHLNPYSEQSDYIFDIDYPGGHSESKTETAAIEHAKKINAQ